MPKKIQITAELLARLAVHLTDADTRIEESENEARAILRLLEFARSDVGHVRSILLALADELEKPAASDDVGTYQPDPDPEAGTYQPDAETELPAELPPVVARDEVQVTCLDSDCGVVYGQRRIAGTLWPPTCCGVCGSRTVQID